MAGDRKLVYGLSPSLRGRHLDRREHGSGRDQGLLTQLSERCIAGTTICAFYRAVALVGNCTDMASWRQFLSKLST